MGMVLATGALLGFALGYVLKERKHSDEMASAIRIAKRIIEAKKEEAPKGPPTSPPTNYLPC
jgi:hypothetical protein